jgi:hypothetical protein
VGVAFRLRPDGTYFVRIHGPNGVRELRAVFDTASELCLIQRSDAIELGYNAFYIPEVANLKTKLLTPHYLVKVPFITISKIEVGKLVVENVLTAAQDLSNELGVDFVMGRSLLGNYKLVYDFPRGIVELTEGSP